MATLFLMIISDLTSVLAYNFSPRFSGLSDLFVLVMWPKVILCIMLKVLLGFQPLIQLTSIFELKSYFTKTYFSVMTIFNCIIFFIYIVFAFCVCKKTYISVYVKFLVKIWQVNLRNILSSTLNNSISILHLLSLLSLSYIHSYWLHDYLQNQNEVLLIFNFT